MYKTDCAVFLTGYDAGITDDGEEESLEGPGNHKINNCDVSVCYSPPLG